MAAAAHKLVNKGEKKGRWLICYSLQHYYSLSTPRIDSSIVTTNCHHCNGPAGKRGIGIIIGRCRVDGWREVGIKGAQRHCEFSEVALQ